MLPHGTDIVVSFRVIEQILHKEGIFLILTFLLLMEHIVLDIRNEVMTKQVSIVLLTAVA